MAAPWVHAAQAFGALATASQHAATPIAQQIPHLLRPFSSTNNGAQNGPSTIGGSIVQRLGSVRSGSSSNSSNSSSASSNSGSLSSKVVGAPVAGSSSALPLSAAIRATGEHSLFLSVRPAFAPTHARNASSTSAHSGASGSVSSGSSTSGDRSITPPRHQQITTSSGISGGGPFQWTRSGSFLFPSAFGFTATQQHQQQAQLMRSLHTRSSVDAPSASAASATTSSSPYPPSFLSSPSPSASFDDSSLFSAVGETDDTLRDDRRMLAEVEERDRIMSSMGMGMGMGETVSASAINPHTVPPMRRNSGMSATSTSTSGPTSQRSVITPRRITPASPTDAMSRTAQQNVHLWLQNDAELAAIERTDARMRMEELMEQGEDVEFEEESPEDPSLIASLSPRDASRVIIESLLEMSQDLEPSYAREKRSLRSMPHNPITFFATRPETLDNYTLLLRVHAAKHLYEEGMSVYQTMRARGLQPDDQTYCALVAICKSVTPDRSTNLARLDRAFGVMSEYKASHGGRMTEGFFNGLVQAAGALDGWERAYSVVDMMRKHGVTPTRLVYTSLLHACRKDGSIPALVRAKATFTQMQNAGLGAPLEPDTSAYNVMLRMAGDANAPEYAINLFDEMRQKHYIPDLHTYANLIHACAKSSTFYTQAFDYFTQALAQGFKADVRLYNLLIQACARNCDVANALHVFRLMVEQGVTRDTSSYNALLSALARSQAIDSVPSSIHTPDDITQPIQHGAMLSKEDRMDMAMKLLQQMEETNVHIDRQTINTVVEVTCKALRLQKAVSLQKELFAKYNMTPDFYTHRMFVDMYTSASRIPMAIERVEAMHAAGYKAIKPMYDGMLRKVRRQKKGQSAQMLSELGQRIIGLAQQDGVHIREEDIRLFDPVKYAQHLEQERQQRLERDTIKRGMAFTFSQRDDALIRPAKAREGSGRPGSQATRHAANPKLKQNKIMRDRRAADKVERMRGRNPEKIRQQQESAGHYW